MGEKSILDWTVKQLDWRKDALRRHAQASSFLLDDIDKAAILARVMKAAGFEQDGQLDHLPLNKDHLNIDKTEGRKALLVSLGPVENLARIAKGQQLRFALDGLTIVYGDNASGKSGYCRITKKVCRSQTRDDLLGDVFQEGPLPPAEVFIRYILEGDEQPTAVTWKDGTPPPKAISSISVFDSRNARFYIDQQNRVEFLPLEISLLECHGGHCKEMQSTFEAERKALEHRIAVPLPGGFTSGGVVAQHLASLVLRTSQLPSVARLTELATWTEDNKTELETLAKTLALDPSALASREDRSKTALAVYETLLPEIESRLADNVASDLETKFKAVQVASKTAALAAEEAFAGEPLPGVGDGPWRQMYEHAKAYVEAAGIGAEIPSTAGELCALCQQPLSESASARLTRFNNYIAGETSKREAEASADFDRVIKPLKQLRILDKGTETRALAEYKDTGSSQSQLVASIESFLECASKRRDELLYACTNGDFAQVTAMPVSILAQVRQETGRLQQSAEAFRDQIRLDTMRAQSVARQSELKDRERLHDVLATVLARRADLERHAKISECERLVDTQQLSTFITKHRRELFTESLQRRIQAEIDNFDLGHIPFAVIDRSRDGQSEFKVGINAKSLVANDKILSEGEQRALALACFLADAAGDDVQHGMVIDDPVSSLDHLRIRLVAKRLAEEAGKGRQLIIFTHNLLFYNELLREAAAAEPQVLTARRVITKSRSEGFGIVSENAEPWTARKVEARISALQYRLVEIGSVYSDFHTDGYRSIAKDFYTDLRETWERLVETLLLGAVVERYGSDVKTQSLKMVEVEDEDYRTVYHAMKKVSERSGHDTAAGRQIPIPSPSEMKADLEVIDTFRKKLKKRNGETEKRRRAQEGPPAARVWD